MQLMHNGEGLPSLNKRRELFSTCPHKRIYLLLNLKSEEKKAPSGSAPSGSAPRPSEEDGPKWPPVTGL